MERKEGPISSRGKMPKERPAAFMDAVLAIVMTILVLDLPRPTVMSVAGFWELRHDFFAYALSFFWLGSMWVNMHNEWDGVEVVDTSVLWRMVLLLFCSSLIPYATGVVSDAMYSAVAQAFYGICVIALTLANVWLSRALASANADESPDVINRMERRQSALLLDCAIKVAGLALAVFVWPPAMMVSVLVAAAFITVVVRREGLV
ncbi:MAG: TMEM175 family protein [Tractidigestivibacter sp.]|jgi:uncharacterized membrane protein|uniref:TMEM175 family protein n=1 Tax=Tractidigestivibacter sp. TaxID=2847320 RepID=UPI003D8E48D9